jgi:midasin (ATPase involved in ribosome maturation)
MKAVKIASSFPYDNVQFCEKSVLDLCAYSGLCSTDGYLIFREVKKISKQPQTHMKYNVYVTVNYVAIYRKV